MRTAIIIGSLTIAISINPEQTISLITSVFIILWGLYCMVTDMKDDWGKK